MCVFSVCSVRRASLCASVIVLVICDQEMPEEDDEEVFREDEPSVRLFRDVQVCGDRRDRLDLNFVRMISRVRFVLKSFAWEN